MSRAPAITHAINGRFGKKEGRERTGIKYDGQIGRLL